MGPLDWLRGLFSRDAGADAPDDEATATAEATRRCSVCGTTTDASECPLCHGSDLVPLQDGAAASDRSTKQTATPATTRDDPTDDAVGRLREVRETHDER